MVGGLIEMVDGLGIMVDDCVIIGHQLKNMLKNLSFLNRNFC